MRVLIACEFSGTVRRAFRERGHEAWSCDLLPADDGGEHLLGDVRQYLGDGWDLMIGHPPCTYLTNAGVRHLHSVPSRNGTLPKIHGEARWEMMRRDAAFFCDLKNAPIEKIAIENPTPHGYAREIIGKYDQAVQPWQFGHGETKRTCFWLKNLLPLIPTDIVDGRWGRVHHTSPSKDRWKIRSLTYSGIAAAMAEQWG